jgi:EAL domain-containing protein (putative c-di-GMP-specific phosphodiesterase class I)
MMQHKVVEASQHVEIIEENAESMLLDMLQHIQHDFERYHAIHFKLSQLKPEYRTSFQRKIAANIMREVFRSDVAIAYILSDDDLIILFKTTRYAAYSEKLVIKIIYQLRYLYMDDAIAYRMDKTENPDFCCRFKLLTQFDMFVYHIKQKIIALSQLNTGVTHGKVKELVEFTPEQLVQVLEDIRSEDIQEALRHQPICTVTKELKLKKIVDEIYVSVTQLSEMLNDSVSLTSNYSLFIHVTRVLDRHVLMLLRKGEYPAYQGASVSLNLNVATIHSEYFKAFDRTISKEFKKTVIIEFHVSDVFIDIQSFHKARDLLRDLGYRICLDGLNNYTIVQVSPKLLGVDLVKMAWNADLVSSLKDHDNDTLVQTIKTINPARVILCRCDSKHAIDYGHALGISLFQGWFIDKLYAAPQTAIANTNR